MELPKVQCSVPYYLLVNALPANLTSSLKFVNDEDFSSYQKDVDELA